MVPDDPNAIWGLSLESFFFCVFQVFYVAQFFGWQVRSSTNLEGLFSKGARKSLYDAANCVSIAVTGGTISLRFADKYKDLGTFTDPSLDVSSEIAVKSLKEGDATYETKDFVQQVDTPIKEVQFRSVLHLVEGFVPVWCVQQAALRPVQTHPQRSYEYL